MKTTKKIVATSTAPVRGFSKGFAYPLRGWRFLFAHPSLIRFWIWPIFITFVCLVGVGYGAWHLHEDVVNLFWSAPDGDGWLASVLAFLRGALSFVMGILLFAFGLVLVVLIASPIAAPFNDALSQAVEKVEAGNEAPPFALGAVLRDLLRTVAFEAGYIGIMLTTFVLSLVVPVLGPAVHTVFGFVVTASYWALSYIDWPAARRGLSLGRRIGLVRAQFVTMFGFGCAVWLMLFVPLLNLFFMPAAVAGGTLLVLDLERTGALDASPGHAPKSP